MKKILSILLSVMLVASVFVTSAYALDNDADQAIPVPTVDDEQNPVYFYNQDFSNVSVDDLPITASTNHNISISEDIDPHFVLSTTYTSATITYFRINTINIDSNYDSIVYEFDITSSGLGQMQVGVSTDDKLKGAAAKFVFRNNNIFAVTKYAGYISTDYNQNGDVVASDVWNSNDKLHFIVEVNADSTWSLWVDEINVVNNKSVRYMSTNGISALKNLVFRTQGANTWMLDNLKVYQSQPRPKDTVDNVLAKITDSTIGTVDETTNAITIDDDILVGSDILGDSTIAFESAKGNINNNGTVKFPLISTNDIVTIKVTNTYKGTTYTGSKNFDVTIPSNLSIGNATLSNFTAGQTATVTIPVTVKDTESDSIVTVFMATYDSTGKELLAIGTSNNQTVTGDELSVSAILPANLPADATVKVFVLDSANTANPLTKVTVQ